MDLVNRRLAALVVVGAVALFSPLAAAFSRSSLVAGIPLMPLYIFACWGALVLGAWAVTGRRPR